MSGMDENAKICERCQTAETPNRKYKYCPSCREETNQPCRKEGCENKRTIENAYCRLHKLHAFREEVEAKGLKLCSGYLRGCRAELHSDYSKKKCADCLLKEREKEKKLMEKKKETMPEIEETTGNKLCGNCFQYRLPSDFLGEKGGVVVRCFHCRELGKKADANRDKEHRNTLERAAAQRPNRQATKQEWAQYNKDKVLLKDRKYKAKMYLENPDAVLEKGREQAAVFREKNPKKMQAANESKRLSKEHAYTICKHTASSKKLSFEYTKEWFFETIVRPCHYCGGVEEKGFNGIDRLDCRVGYTVANGVPCCAMCNQLKGSLSEHVFLMRVEHVCAHGGWIEGGRKRPDVFPDSLGATLSGVQSRANKLKLPFELTATFFEELHRNGCYLCGKTNGETHRNGTDRIVNEGGYVMSNVQPCCGQCNYMKKDYELDVFRNQLVAVYRYRAIGAISFPDSVESEGKKSIEKHLDKVSKQEKAAKKEEKKKAKIEKIEAEWPELVSR